MTILLSDPRVHAVPVLDNGEPLVPLLPSLSPTRSAVRSGLADRLYAAALALPADVSLRVVEGHRTAHDQSAIIASYTAELRRLHPDLPRRRAGPTDQPVRRPAGRGAPRGRRAPST